MPNLETLGKMILICGVLIAASGLIIFIFGRLGLGRLPGDIFIQRENVTFYFPLATMLLVSIVLTIIINILRR